ncbi:MAG: hypothetical protein WC254_00200 [Candidatus Woesearchaeota archaeon]|jgi:hypothetical protein
MSIDAIVKTVEVPLVDPTTKRYRLVPLEHYGLRGLENGILDCVIHGTHIQIYLNSVRIAVFPIDESKGSLHFEYSSEPSKPFKIIGVSFFNVTELVLPANLVDIQNYTPLNELRDSDEVYSHNGRSVNLFSEAEGERIFYGEIFARFTPESLSGQEIRRFQCSLRNKMQRTTAGYLRYTQDGTRVQIHETGHGKKYLLNREVANQCLRYLVDKGFNGASFFSVSERVLPTPTLVDIQKYIPLNEIRNSGSAYSYDEKSVRLFSEAEGERIPFGNIFARFTQESLSVQEARNFQGKLRNHIQKTTAGNMRYTQEGRRVQPHETGHGKQFFLEREVANQCLIYLVDKGFNGARW